MENNMVKVNKTEKMLNGVWGEYSISYCGYLFVSSLQKMILVYNNRKTLKFSHEG